MPERATRQEIEQAFVGLMEAADVPYNKAHLYTFTDATFGYPIGCCLDHNGQGWRVEAADGDRNGGDGFFTCDRLDARTFLAALRFATRFANYSKPIPT